jgi:hypothetical protein
MKKARNERKSKFKIKKTPLLFQILFDCKFNEKKI